MDPDLFYEPYFDFSLRKPKTWRFVPAQWSPVARLKKLDHPAAEWAKNAATPFCCAMWHHDSSLHAPSAVQVSARPMIEHSAGLASTILEGQLSLLKAKYPDFHMLEACSTGVVAGCRAVYVRGTFVVVSSPLDNPVPMHILSRVFVVFSERALFSIGLSGSSDPKYYSESDFECILSSARIGA